MMCRRYRWNLSFRKGSIHFFMMVTMAVFSAASCADRIQEVAGIRGVDLPVMPPVAGKAVQPGLAGPVAGVTESGLLVGGGANFEGEMPWRGGAKSYHDEIFLLETTEAEEPAWRMASERLPYPMAYPACLSLKEGILSMGGETVNGPVSDVFLLSVDKGKVVISPFPSLPCPLTSPGAALAGGKVYLAGGLDSSGAADAFMFLDPTETEKGWQRLPPLPVPLSHSVVAAQSDGNEQCIYLFGGRNKTTDVHTFFSDIWKFTPSTGEWTLEGNITKDGNPLPLSAGTGIAAGKNQIVLFGGDPGIYFNRTEMLNNVIALAEDSLKTDLLREKDSLLSNHPGFNREVMVYNTVRKSWAVIGEAPQGLPVTTVVFCRNDLVIIPGVEIRPGVRTPGITAFRFK